VVRAAGDSSGNSKWEWTARLHPIGWVAALFGLVAAVLRVAVDSDLLVASLPWPLWLAVLAVIAVSAFPVVLHGLRRGIEAITRFNGAIIWVLAWVVFGLQLFNVVTRYTNNWFETDILFGQTTSLAWMTFGMLFLLGVNFGVLTGVNPRIDFWWADFPPRRKAWIDFVLHVLLFLPFLVVGIRALRPYAAINLGQRFDGTFPSGWRVWESWVRAGDADQLPVGPIRAFILVGFVLWALQIVAEIIKTGFVIVGRDDLGEITATEGPVRVE
jgi:TRAP-type mannitol/chloroaromatic compound transport system permease small subunit